MAARPEHILEFPVESVKKLTGFSLDIGGSVCKVVYIHKDDWEELQKAKPEPKKGKLRLTYFRSEDASEAFELLKDVCHIKRSEEETSPMVYTTGIGSNQGAKTIQEKLDVKLTNLSEFDCFIDGFIYLSTTLPMDEFTIPLSKKVLQHTYKVVKGKIDAFKLLTCADKLEDTHTETADGPQYKLPRPLDTGMEFPSLLIMCGSAFAAMKIERNGDFCVLDGANNGGRTFIGMGSLLTGAKTYDELIDMAEKGDNRNVDLFLRDLAKKEDSEDGYAKALNVQEHGDIIFHFYKAIGKKLDDFKPEDLALALLHMQTQQLAQMVLYSCIRGKVNHAFFCGSFFNRELVRDVMTASLTNRMIFVDALKNKLKVDFGFHFIRNGSHLGALGALVHPLLPQPEAASAADTATAAEK